MAAGRGPTQCAAQKARVENVKSRSFYTCSGRKKFYSRRACCASAVGRNELIWSLESVILPNRSPTMACCGPSRIGLTFLLSKGYPCPLRCCHEPSTDRLPVRVREFSNHCKLRDPDRESFERENTGHLRFSAFWSLPWDIPGWAQFQKHASGMN